LRCRVAVGSICRIAAGSRCPTGPHHHAAPSPVGDGSRSCCFLQIKLPTVRPCSLFRWEGPADQVAASSDVQLPLLQGTNQGAASFFGSNSPPSAPALCPVGRNMVAVSSERWRRFSPMVSVVKSHEDTTGYVGSACLRTLVFLAVFFFCN
jgi:hypothetical protein